MDDIWSAYHALYHGGEAPVEERVDEDDTQLYSYADVEFSSDDPILEKVEMLEEAQLMVKVDGLHTEHEVIAGALPTDEIPSILDPKEELIEIGEVESTFKDLSIISARGHAVMPGSLLSTGDYVPIGRAREVFGSIDDPKVIVPTVLEPGMKIFAVKRETAFADPALIHKTYVGCDASNRFDEPAKQDEQMFSDDEEEAMARRAARQKKKKLNFDPV